MFFDRAPNTNKSSIENKLETATPKTIEQINEFEDHIYLVSFDKNTSGIFKPKEKEWAEGKGIPVGTLYLRERAAYLVDKAIGFNLVPPTVIRTIDGKIGSLQEYIPNARVFGKLEWNAQEKIKKANLDKFNDLGIMNYIIFGTDSNKSNLLIDKKNHFFAIDNALSFGDTELDTFVDFKGERISRETTKKINLFSSSLYKKNELLNQLTSLLQASEVAACLNRIDHVSQLLKQHNGIPFKEKLLFNPALTVSKAPSPLSFGT